MINSRTSKTQHIKCSRISYVLNVSESLDQIKIAFLSKPATTNLHDIVLRHAADDPGVVGVPGEVGYLGGVTAVDEEQLGRAVLGVLRALLLADLHIKVNKLFTT